MTRQVPETDKISECDGSETFWRELLHGIGEPTRLSLPQREDDSSIHHSRSITLTHDTTASLRAASARLSITLPPFIQAAWAILLGRYTREDVVVFGVRHSVLSEHEGNPGRSASVLSECLPVRVEVGPKFLVSDVLKKLQSHQDMAHRHASMRPSAIQEWISVKPPFGSIVFADDNSSAHGVSLALRFSGNAQLLLEIIASPESGPSAVDRMLGHLATILTAIPEFLERPIAALPMLTTCERKQLATWNETARPFPAEKCIHELIEEIAKRTPSRLAVKFGEMTLTYGELNARSNQLARHLRERGVTAGSIVGINLDRSCELLVSLLAVLKAGAAYVPLDPAFPADRIAYMTENSGTVLIITQEQSTSTHSFENVGVIRLNREWPTIARESAANLELSISSRSLAYVMHTSGSTGRPKGIAIEHRSVMNFLESMRNEPGILEDDVLLAVTTISFDISVLEIFLPLIVGARVLMVSREVSTDPSLLATSIEDATIMQATPATWHALVESGWKGNPKLKILCGGEAMTPDLVGKLLPRCRELWNMYGPTETTVWSTCQRITAVESPISVGRPIANTSVHILGNGLQQQPVDVAGELYIGGDGLAREYWNLPELTAEKFIPDPFSGHPAARLYATGDLARIRPDGAIEVLGRIDRQIKIRGFRIESGEIETRLNAYPGVRQSTIVAHEYAGGEKAIIAYLASTFSEVPEHRLRAFLKETLPGYMIPSAFILVAAIPLTPNGKVDVNALPPPVSQLPSPSREFLAPRNQTEEALAAMWRAILHREAVGVRDSFFDLGGHSLTAAALAARVNSAFNISLPLRAIFEQPTIEELASIIAGSSPKGGNDLPSFHSDPAHAYDPFPLNEMQQAYVSGRSAGFDLGNISLHDYVEFEPAQFDLARANAALRALIRRHPMLRAVICGEGMQRVMESVPDYTIASDDLRGHPTESIETRIASERARMSHRVYDLAVWPWFEIRAFQLHNDRFRLLISCDAVMIDAWSSYRLQREFAVLFEDPDALRPTPEVTFRDYVLTEASTRETESYRRARDYWNSRLPSIPPPPSLPLAKSPTDVKEPRFARRSTRMEAKEWTEFQFFAAKCSITPGAALIAAYSIVLARWSQNHHFCLNLPIFNRPPLHAHINDVVGQFTSLSLLAVDLSEPGSFKTHALAIQRQLWSDLDHRSYSGVHVMRDLARHHGSSGAGNAPIVTTNIMLDDGFQTTLRGSVPFAITQAPQVLLEQVAAISDGALIVWWDAVTELFPGNLLAEMFAAFTGLISTLAKDERAWTTERVTLPLREREAGAVTNESPELLHTLFLRQVPLRLDEPAVISPSRTLGYGELHRRAMRVAECLRESGVQPNTLVAIVMEKGWEQVVAAIGILYSGAAYVPIEAKLPAERLEYLLSHGEIAVALTQSHSSRDIRWPASVRPVLVDELSEHLGEFSGPLQKPTDLAYVIYTSGSTGQPKGVMIDHLGAVNTILDINQRFRVSASDRVISLSSLSFDLSVYDLFGMLAAGGALVIPGADSTLDPAHWADMVLRHGVSIWNTVPALMNLFAEYAARHPAMSTNKLRLALLSGDWIPLTLPAQIRTVAPNAEVISLGGATEASIWSILYPIENTEVAWKSIPYGRAMVNQSLHVLDGSLQPCPDWVVGELYIGGIGLAKGYWRDPEKSEMSFFTHPRTGERLYRTGDLGRWMPDGYIEFLGRKDFQVKVQGFRIELEEIESALLQFPGLAAAVVTARGARHDNKRLVAYIVSKIGPIASAALRDFLLKKLPAYMVPSAFATLDRLPLSANGKVDRAALRDITEVSDALTTNAADAVTAQMTKIVERILKVGRVEPDANLLNLGADSLNLISIVNMIDREMQFRPKISDLYRQPTIAAMVSAYHSAELQMPRPVKNDNSELLERIKKMSPEQIKSMLAAKKA